MSKAHETQEVARQNNPNDNTRSQQEKEAAPTWYRRQLEAQRGSTPVEKERSRSDWGGGRWSGRG